MAIFREHSLTTANFGGFIGGLSKTAFVVAIGYQPFLPINVAHAAPSFIGPQVFVFPQAPGGRIRGLGFPRISSGGRSALRTLSGSGLCLYPKAARIQAGWNVIAAPFMQ
ncbi:hypothetical protein [Novosphingobium naphthalenivorans]|uniref:hypothetical protein n=1 Tax=Novosphingobium naphthalenivorans TaxID=273168 RepID=UPI0012ED0EC0|nr:hypothetical protein [Novosphingobium naphthalenivorans]